MRIPFGDTPPNSAQFLALKKMDIKVTVNNNKYYYLNIPNDPDFTCEKDSPSRGINNYTIRYLGETIITVATKNNPLRIYDNEVIPTIDIAKINSIYQKSREHIRSNATEINELTAEINQVHIINGLSSYHKKLYEKYEKIRDVFVFNIAHDQTFDNLSFEDACDKNNMTSHLADLLLLKNENVAEYNRFFNDPKFEPIIGPFYKKLEHLFPNLQMPEKNNPQEGTRRQLT